jgi:hypothetical protein
MSKKAFEEPKLTKQGDATKITEWGDSYFGTVTYDGHDDHNSWSWWW